MKILISLTTKSHIHAETCKWLLAQDSEKCAIDILNTRSPLEHARNLQVKRFLDSPFDILFIVDSDCVPKKNTIDMILNFDLPILSIPHPAIKENDKGENELGLMVLDSDGKGNYVQNLPLKDLQKCDAVGCSGLAIKREVFERLEKPYFKFVFDNNGYLSKSEDFYFCDKVKSTGYEIYAWCKEPQNHYVEVVI